MVVIAMPAHGLTIRLDAHDLGLISEADWRRYTAKTIRSAQMIYAYREAILRDERGPQKDPSADGRLD
jgi:hypothetical protein